MSLSVSLTREKNYLDRIYFKSYIAVKVSYVRKATFLQAAPFIRSFSFIRASNLLAETECS